MSIFFWSWMLSATSLLELLRSPSTRPNLRTGILGMISHTGDKPSVFCMHTGEKHSRFLAHLPWTQPFTQTHTGDRPPSLTTLTPRFKGSITQLKITGTDVGLWGYKENGGYMSPTQVRNPSVRQCSSTVFFLGSWGPAVLFRALLWDLSHNCWNVPPGYCCLQ